MCTILQAQLLRAEYMQKAGAVGSSDLYQIYNTLQRMDVPSEDLHHRVALFCDNMYTMSSQNEQLKVVIDYEEEMFFVMLFFLALLFVFTMIYIVLLFGYHGYHSSFNVQIRGVRSFYLKIFEVEVRTLDSDPHRACAEHPQVLFECTQIRSQSSLPRNAQNAHHLVGRQRVEGKEETFIRL